MIYLALDRFSGKGPVTTPEVASSAMRLPADPHKGGVAALRPRFSADACRTARWSTVTAGWPTLPRLDLLVGRFAHVAHLELEAQRDAGQRMVGVEHHVAG